MSERYDWRIEALKKLEELGLKQTVRPYGKGGFCIEVTWPNEPLEVIRERFGIPKTPPEPTDEELLDEFSAGLGKGWDEDCPGDVARLFCAAAHQANVEITGWGGFSATEGYTGQRRRDSYRAACGGKGCPDPCDTPAEALRSALAAYLRAEWRRKQGGGE